MRLPVEGPALDTPSLVAAPNSREASSKRLVVRCLDAGRGDPPPTEDVGELRKRALLPGRPRPAVGRGGVGESKRWASAVAAED